MTIKSFGIFFLIVVLLIIGTGIRLTGLKDVDIFCDEAFFVEVSESLIKYGELNNFRYQEFFREHAFRYDMMAHIPPLYCFIQAPFMLLRGVLHLNIVPRLPSLLASIFLMIMLYFISKELFSSKIVGLIVIMLTIFNGYQIIMSRLVLPYSVLPLFLCLVFWFLIHALKKNEKRYWVLTSIFLILSFYIHQHALFFGFMYLTALIICFMKNEKNRVLNLTICFFTSFLASLIWILFFSKGLFYNRAFFTYGVDYDIFLQLSLIMKGYHHMLPFRILEIAFLIGFARIFYEIVRQKGYIKILLVVWALLPFTFMLSQTMWIQFYHFFFVYPPIIIITAYGVYVFIRYALDKVYLRYLSMNRHTYSAIIFLFSIAISALQLKHTNIWSGGRWVEIEFGNPNIVSRACDYIKQHYDNEVIIAPRGISESYYLDKYVYCKIPSDVGDRHFRLILESSAWVFMRDQFSIIDEADDEAELYEFYRYVQKNGKFIMSSDPMLDATSPEDSSGYALYYIEKQSSIPGFN